MRFLRVIKLTKAEKNLPLSPEDYIYIVKKTFLAKIDSLADILDL